MYCTCNDNEKASLNCIPKHPSMSMGHFAKHPAGPLTCSVSKLSVHVLWLIYWVFMKSLFGGFIVAHFWGINLHVPIVATHWWPFYHPQLVAKYSGVSTQAGFIVVKYHLFLYKIKKTKILIKNLFIIVLCTYAVVNSSVSVLDTHHKHSSVVKNTSCLLHMYYSK